MLRQRRAGPIAAGPKEAPMTDAELKDRSETHADANIRFYGVHHLALNTEDMKMTVDFYAGVLGMQLVHAMKVPPGLGTGPGNRGNPPFEEVRHYFFDMGNDSLLAFFEIPKGKEPAGNRNAIGAMQHCAFVVTAARFREVEERLKARGIDYIGPIPQLSGLLGIYFYDPNGIRLEFACQPEDGETPAVIPCLTQTKTEVRAELATLPGVSPQWIEERLSALPE